MPFEQKGSLFLRYNGKEKVLIPEEIEEIGDFAFCGADVPPCSSAFFR